MTALINVAMCAVQAEANLSALGIHAPTMMHLCHNHGSHTPMMLIKMLCVRSTLKCHERLENEVEWPSSRCIDEPTSDWQLRNAGYVAPSQHFSHKLLANFCGSCSWALKWLEFFEIYLIELFEAVDGDFLRWSGKFLLEDLGCSEDKFGLCVPSNTENIEVPGIILVWLAVASGGIEAVDEED